MKSKLSVNDQINHLKNKQIRFNIMNEEQAINYLTYNTYYYKLKQYAHAFEYNKTKHYYINLEFAYMVELYELDKALKEILYPFCIKTEEALKIRLIRDITDNTNEDGYSIVTRLFSKYDYIEKNLKNRNAKFANNDFLNIPVWELVDHLTLGELHRLFNIYYDLYPNNKIDTLRQYIWSLKHLRDDVAHDNSLLSEIRNEELSQKIITYRNRRLYSFLAQIPDISKNTRKNKMANPFINELISVLFLFNELVVDEKVKRHQYALFLTLLNNRFTRNYDYFKNDNIMISSYQFIKKVIDYLYQNNI